MLLPQVYMILKQKKLKGLVAAIALFKQASETTAVPVQTQHCANYQGYLS